MFSAFSAQAKVTSSQAEFTPLDDEPLDDIYTLRSYFTTPNPNMVWGSGASMSPFCGCMCAKRSHEVLLSKQQLFELMFVRFCRCTCTHW